MKVHKLFIIAIFALGLAAGLYLANSNVELISPVVAKSHMEEPMISPTEARERDFYAPNSETLAPDEMRVIACGTGMPTPRPAQAAACFLCLLYTSPSPRDQRGSRMPSSA